MTNYWRFSILAVSLALPLTAAFADNCWTAAEHDSMVAEVTWSKGTSDVMVADVTWTAIEPSIRVAEVLWTKDESNIMLADWTWNTPTTDPATGAPAPRSVITG